MVDAEILKQVRTIQIRARRQVAELLAGGYASVFRGQGMEFDEIRPYVPGDDVRTIDWNVTARFGLPYIKRFREERELTVMLLVDLSASGDFGSGTRAKRRALAELGAILALSAVGGGDKVGLVLFTDGIELYIPPKRGRTHVLRLIRELLAFEPAGRGTSIRGALEFLGRVRKRRAVAFLLSDFRDEGWEHALTVAARRHDVICLRAHDPREETLPTVGLVELRDLETDERRLVDTSDPGVRERFAVNARERAAVVESACTRARADTVDVPVDRPLAEPVARFFQRRERRR